jgi:hypothetical protein
MNGRAAAVAKVSSRPWNARAFGDCAQNAHDLDVYTNDLDRDTLLHAHTLLPSALVSVPFGDCISLSSSSSSSVMTKLSRHGSTDAFDWTSRKITARHADTPPFFALHSR